MEQYVEIREYEIDGKIVYGVEAFVEERKNVYCELSSIEAGVFYDSVSDAMTEVMEIINGE